MLGTAYQWGLIKENICNRVKPPKVPKKKHQILSIEDSKNLLEALNKESFKNKLIVMIAIFTGFRRGEIMGLEW